MARPVPVSLSLPPARKPFERAPMVPALPRVQGRVHIRVERCKGCELCIEFCPSDVLVRSDDFNPKGYHYPIARNEGNCINCRLCLTVCPEYAIFSTVRRPGAAPTNQGGSACCS